MCLGFDYGHQLTNFNYFDSSVARGAGVGLCCSLALAMTGFQNNKVWIGSLREGTHRGAIRQWLVAEGVDNGDILNVYVKSVPGADSYAFVVTSSHEVCGIII